MTNNPERFAIVYCRTAAGMKPFEGFGLLYLLPFQRNLTSPIFRRHEAAEAREIELRRAIFAITGSLHFLETGGVAVFHGPVQNEQTIRCVANFMIERYPESCEQRRPYLCRAPILIRGTAYPTRKSQITNQYQYD